VSSPDPNTDRMDNRRGGRISLQTLIIASLASAAAAFGASRIWGTGTLISAAVTPVVVALVSEFLRRPVQTVAATAQKIPTVQTLPAVRERTTATPEDPARVLQDPSRVTTDPATPAEPHSPAGQPPPRPRVEPPAVITPVVDPGTIKHAEANTWRPRWRVAVVTGLLACAIVVALYTVPDLLAGQSVTGNGQPTTFFGGSTIVKKNTSPTTTATTTTSATTLTKTAPATSTTRTTTTAATPTTKTTTTTTTTTPTSSHTTSTTSPAINPTTTPTSPAP
jgi:hypothetical protein